MDYSRLHYWKIKLTRLKFAMLCFFFFHFFPTRVPQHASPQVPSSSTHGDLSKSMQVLLHYDNIGAQCYLKTRECEKLGDRGERILVSAQSAQQLGSWIKRGKKKKGETDSTREAEEFEKSGEKNEKRRASQTWAEALNWLFSLNELMTISSLDLFLSIFSDAYNIFEKTFFEPNISLC